MSKPTGWPAVWAAMTGAFNAAAGRKVTAKLAGIRASAKARRARATGRRPKAWKRPPPTVLFTATLEEPRARQRLDEPVLSAAHRLRERERMKL